MDRSTSVDKYSYVEQIVEMQFLIEEAIPPAVPISR